MKFSDVSVLEEDPNGFTVDMWICVNGPVDLPMTVVDVHCMTGNFTLQIRPNDRVVLYQRDLLELGGGTSQAFASSSPLFDGAWHLLQVSWRPQKVIRIDGKKVQITVDQLDVVNRVSRNTRGDDVVLYGCKKAPGFPDEVAEPFRGKMAEVRLWTSSKGTKRTLLSRLALDDGKGDEVRDTIRPHRATVSNAKWARSQDPFPPTVLRFTGCNYITGGSLNMGEKLQHLEVSFWIATRLSHQMTVLGVTDCQKRHMGFRVMLNTDTQGRQEEGTLFLELTDAAGRRRVGCYKPHLVAPPEPQTSLRDGRWHHIKWTVCDGVFRLEVDGKLATDEELSQFNVGGRSAPREYLPLVDFIAIGGHNNRGVVSSFFEGLLARVMLGACEEGRDSECYGFWSLNDGPGATLLADSSGRMNHAVHRLGTAAEKGGSADRHHGVDRASPDWLPLPRPPKCVLRSSVVPIELQDASHSPRGGTLSPRLVSPTLHLYAATPQLAPLKSPVMSDGDDTIPISFIRRRRKTLEAQQVTTQVAGTMRQLVVHEGVEEAVACALEALSEICNRPRLVASVSKWLDSKRLTTSCHQPSLLQSGLADAADPTVLLKRALYEPTYTPRRDIWKALEDIESWKTPFDPLFDAEVVKDLMWNCRLISSRHASGREASLVAPIVAMSSTIHTRVTWGLWATGKEGGEWKEVENTDDLEEAFEECADTIAIAPGATMQEIVREITNSASSNLKAVGSRGAAQRRSSVQAQLLELRLMVAYEDGLSVYSDSHGGILLVRFENTLRGDTERSPLTDTVAWLPTPTHAFSESSHLSHDAIPHAGILEYIASRPWTEKLSGESWLCYPIADEISSGLIKKSLSAPNPASTSPEMNAVLHRLLRVGITMPPNQEDDSIDADLLREIVVTRFKLDGHDSDRPPVFAITEALELQSVRWKGQHYILVSAGRKPLLVNKHTGDITRLWRLAREYPRQVHHEVNTAIINYQRGTAPHIEIKAERLLESSVSHPDDVCGTYVVPSSDDRTDELVFVKEKTKHIASYTECLEGGSWEISSVDADAPSIIFDKDCVEYHMGSYLIDSVRPLVYFLDRALAAFPAVGKGTMYKSLQLVGPIPRVYAKGGTVMWSGYTFATSNMPAALEEIVGHTEGIVFTLQCSELRDVVAVSRFPRQRLYMAPSLSLWVLESAEERVFPMSGAATELSLTQVDRLEALTHYVRNIMSTVSSSGAMLHIAQLMEVLQGLVALRSTWGTDQARARLTDLLLKVADPSGHLLHSPDGCALAKELIACGAEASALSTALRKSWATAHSVEHLDIAVALLRCGAPHQAISHTSFGALGENSSYGTPLHLAVRELDRPEYMKPMVELFHISVSCTDEQGRTPLHWAADLGKLAVLQELLDLGADPSLVDQAGCNVLHISAANPVFERSEYGLQLIREMCSWKAALEAKDSNGCTPFAVAQNAFHWAISDEMLSCGANPEPASPQLSHHEPNESWKRLLDSAMGEWGETS